MSDASRDRVCDNCGRWVETTEAIFQVTVTLVAEPGPEIELPPVEDPRSEYERLIEKMKNMNPDAVREAEEEVHEQYHFALCPACRKELHGWLKQRTRLEE